MFHKNAGVRNPMAALFLSIVHTIFRDVSALRDDRANGFAADVVAIRGKK